jgi:hypothetical protein
MGATAADAACMCATAHRPFRLAMQARSLYRSDDRVASWACASFLFIPCMSLSPVEEQVIGTAVSSYVIVACITHGRPRKGNAPRLYKIIVVMSHRRASGLSIACRVCLPVITNGRNDFSSCMKRVPGIHFAKQPSLSLMHDARSEQSNARRPLRSGQTHSVGARASSFRISHIKTPP